MTYCVGMVLQRGLVFMSDTRTNAGLDNISTFKKMKTWSVPGDRIFTALSAGNLGTTQSVISLLDERTKSSADREPALLSAPSMFQAARLVADTLREVIARQRPAGQTADSTFNATMIFGGQIAGSDPKLFLIYPEGNFIEASADTPFFQIGEIKYGRPILVRAFKEDMAFEEAIRLLLVSFDSTMKANLTVGAPLDYLCVERDTMRIAASGRFEGDDPALQTISRIWGDALQQALDGLPGVDLRSV
ncbi:peptidase [Thalassococcus sp. CAU 1522]|uniref:Peptidase n=1 Tax=Thalassococcus arenae TaxID=2851652 RepID=A0ABS6N3K0_9RHOB|nr:peptidase [Thalassococcus arenae]MBV2358600.1 peptidase [Thalassococcus arenae]